MLRLRAHLGRFGVEYNGTWTPAPKGQESNPAFAPLLEKMKKMGVGVFDSVEAQAEAVLQAIPYDKLAKWNEQEI